MNNTRKKPVLGIMGGIASGKSTVAKEFENLGCAVIDADEIAHEALEEAGIKQEVVSLFGKHVIAGSGQIDRRKLADIVFADAEKLSRLNNIVHPVVLARVEQLINEYSAADNVPAIVLDMPLLAEAGWEKRCDKLIFVHCDRQTRAERAEKMGILDESQLDTRENYQNPLDTKADLADNTIDNNFGYSELARQVAEIFSYVVDNE